MGPRVSSIASSMHARLEMETLTDLGEFRSGLGDLFGSPDQPHRQRLIGMPISVKLSAEI